MGLDRTLGFLKWVWTALVRR